MLGMSIEEAIFTPTIRQKFSENKKALALPHPAW